MGISRNLSRLANSVDNSGKVGTSGVSIDLIPSQASQSGKYLTTDGTNPNWAVVNSLPSQTSNSGKYLTTDGTNSNWAVVNSLPSQTSNSGKYLITDGTNASWATVATGGGAVALNSATISANYSIPTGSNGFTVGPVIVANGVSVSIASGQRWLIV